MTDPTRPALMARIRGKGTRPERLVEAALRRFGLRFRRHQTVLPQFVPSWRDDSSRISGRP